MESRSVAFKKQYTNNTTLTFSKRQKNPANHQPEEKKIKGPIFVILVLSPTLYCCMQSDSAVQNPCLWYSEQCDSIALSSQTQMHDKLPSAYWQLYKQFWNPQLSSIIYRDHKFGNAHGRRFYFCPAVSFPSPFCTCALCLCLLLLHYSTVDDETKAVK